MGRRNETAALRSVRSAAGARLRDVASAADTTEQKLRRRVAAIPARGRCAKAAAGALAAAAASREGVPPRTVGTAHPAALTAHLSAMSTSVRDGARGAASWATRTGVHPYPPRGRLARLAATTADPAFSGHRAVALGQAAARSSRCPPAQLTRLSGVEHVGQCAAINPALPAGQIRRLVAASTDPLLRAAAAENPACPTHIVDALSQDDHADVREGAAANPNISVDALRWFADWDGGGFALAAWYGGARNPNCPPDLIETFMQSAAGGSFEGVELSVAGNPNAPRRLHEQIAASGYPESQTELAQNPACAAETLGHLADTSSQAWFEALENPRCPQRLLVESSTNNRLDRRYAVAQNSSCSGELLTRLASDQSVDVRCGVASNPSCPTSLLRRFAADPEVVLRRAAARNPACPAADVEEIAAEDADAEASLLNTLIMLGVR